MKRSTVILSLIIVLLLASNVWWAYGSIDCGISRTYQGASLDDATIALRQTLAILPVVASNPADRTVILEAAKRSADSPASFEKDGFIWVGRIGLKFATDGKLLEVKPG